MSAYLSRRLAAATSIEAPTVGSVNLQVRTGMSVPFAPHMLDGSAPSVTDVNLQVRTGMSVPFQPHMLEKGDTAAAPTVENVNLQVRTGMSVPFPKAGLAALVDDGICSPLRTAWQTSLPYRIA